MGDSDLSTESSDTEEEETPSGTPSETPTATPTGSPLGSGDDLVNLANPRGEAPFRRDNVRAMQRQAAGLPAEEPTEDLLASVGAVSAAIARTDDLLLDLESDFISSSPVSHGGKKKKSKTKKSKFLDKNALAGMVISPPRSYPPPQDEEEEDTSDEADLLLGTTMSGGKPVGADNVDEDGDSIGPLKKRRNGKKKARQHTEAEP